MARSYKILLDTSIILAPLETGIDLKDEIERVIPGKLEIITLDSVVKELDKHPIGLKILESLKVKVIKTGDWPADKAILEFAKKNDVIIATNDKELKREVKKIGRPVVFIRGKTKLELDGYIRW